MYALASVFNFCQHTPRIIKKKSRKVRHKDAQLGRTPCNFAESSLAQAPAICRMQRKPRHVSPGHARGNFSLPPPSIGIGMCVHVFSSSRRVQQFSAPFCLLHARPLRLWSFLPVGAAREGGMASCFGGFCRGRIQTPQRRRRRSRRRGEGSIFLAFFF